MEAPINKRIMATSPKVNSPVLDYFDYVIFFSWLSSLSSIFALFLNEW